MSEGSEIRGKWAEIHRWADQNNACGTIIGQFSAIFDILHSSWHNQCKYHTLWHTFGVQNPTLSGTLVANGTLAVLLCVHVLPSMGVPRQGADRFLLICSIFFFQIHA